MFSASKTAAPASGAYQISNSVRLRSAASAYFSRTPSVPGNQQKFTWSGWVKLGSVSSSNLFVAGTTAGNRFQIGYSNYSITVGENNGSWVIDLTTSAVYRDPSAWYHLVVSVDTTQATSTNRVIVYVNSVAQTLTGTFTSQNLSTTTNSTVEHDIGQSKGAGGGFFDGYLADINFIDGQALTPSSFGQINPTTGVWQPIKYAGTYGTNGFHLAFNNGTSTTTLGNDSSSNGNNWTPNNISLTAGSTYDWMLDSPTPYAGTSYGVGNYAVLNPLANSSTLVDANLRTNGGDKWSISTIGMTSGKWYCEVTVIAVGAESSVGISSQPYSGSAPVVGGTATSWGYYSNNGNKLNNTSGPGVAYGSSYTTSDVIGIALDADAGTLTFYKNNVSQGTAFTGLTSGPYYFAIEGRTSTSANNCAANFGQRPFSYTPPSGYKSLCTYNLPTPTIKNGAAYMAATLYTGNGATRSIVNAVNGVSFAPDFIWCKRRDTSFNHRLNNKITGTSATLFTNNTDAETAWGGLDSFNSNGFSISGDVSINASGGTYVAWQWKAGGTAVTNTAGSITSQVSANTTAGFSVVTYTCQSSGSGTIGHGLGVAPSMIISKGRGTVTSWGTYHVSNGWNGYLVLNGTNSFITDPNGMNNTAPTSSVWTQGTTYAGIGTMVAYCFAAIAGYSAFGSYTGNGSANGPFVFLGFRPRFVLVKSSTAVTAWLIWDTSRNTYNLMDTTMFPNSSAADYVDSTVSIDALSNGFKIRGNSASQNGNGSTYIYAAFAESPFSLSLAR